MATELVWALSGAFIAGAAFGGGAVAYAVHLHIREYKEALKDVMHSEVNRMRKELKLIELPPRNAKYVRRGRR